MKVFCVMADSGGAHEASCLYSIWTSRLGAESEIDRLRGDDPAPGFGYNGGELYALEVEVDMASDKVAE